MNGGITADGKVQTTEMVFAEGRLIMRSST